MPLLITNSYCASITHSYRIAGHHGYMKYPEFATRLHEACEDAKVPITQESLGKFFGVSGTMAWYYLNGEKLPSMDKAIKMASKLGISVEWLLTGKGQKYPVPEGENEDFINISHLSPQAKAAIRALIAILNDAQSHP